MWGRGVCGVGQRGVWVKGKSKIRCDADASTYFWAGEGVTGRLPDMELTGVLILEGWSSDGMSPRTTSTEWARPVARYSARLQQCGTG